MVTVGSLDFKLTADSSQMRREFGQIQREALFAAEGIKTLFSGDFFQGAGIQVLTTSTLTLIDTLYDMNGQISLSQALVSSLKDGFASLIALPIPDFQAEALSSLGLGQAAQALELLSLLSTGLKAIEIPVRIAQAGIELISNALESFRVNLKLLSFALEDIANSVRSAGAQFAPIADLLQGAGKAADRFSTSVERARDGADNAWLSIGRLGENLKKYIGAADQFQSALADLGDAAILFRGFQEANAIIDQFFGSLEDNFNAAKNAESFRNRLQLVSTAAGGAREDLAFLQKQTNDLGQDFSAAAAGFTSFSTATNLAGLSAEQTKDTFAAVSQAASVMGLSTADTSGVFLALQQTLSSGNVQLGELNQLSERIPGAFQAAAAAVGVTTGELKALISTGTVDSAEFLPKFAQQLKVFTESGVVDAMNSGEAAINRFNNALGSFQVAAGQAWLEVGTPAINTFAKALDFATKNEEAFSAVIDSLLVASVIRGAVAVVGFTKATIALSASAGKGNIAMALFGKQIQFNVAQLGKLAAQAAIAYAGVTVFYRIMDRVTDSAKSTRSAIASLDKSISDLKESSRGAGEGLKSALPENPPPTDWLDKFVTGLNNINAASNRAVGIDENFLKIRTNSEKQLNDLLRAIGDFSSQAQQILGKSLEFRTNAANGEGALKELKELEVALKGIEQQRLKVDPKDQKAIAEIAAQEAELLKRRAAAQKEILANQSALNNALTQARQELQNLDPSKLGTKGYEQAKQQLETQISLLETEKFKFDELTQASEATAESITKNFATATQQLDKTFANLQADIEEAFAAGTISQEDAQRQQLAGEQKYLEDRLKLNRETAQKIRTELERNAKLRAVDPTKATLNAEKEEEYKKQLEQIDLDIAKNRVDLAKNVQSTREQLNQQDIDRIREGQAEAEAIVQRSENSRIAAIKQRQQLGKISEEQANKEIEAAQKQSITEQINLEKQKLVDIAELKGQGAISAKDAADQEREVLNNLSDLNLQRIDAELEARKVANEEVIKEFESGLKQAEAALEQSQNNRKLATANAQLGGASAEDAAREELRIEQQTIAQKIALKQKEFAGVQEQRQRGIRSAEEAAEIEQQLIQEIGELRLQQVQSEIKAQKDLLGAISARAAEEVQVSETTEAEKIAAIKEAQAARLVDEQEAARKISEINLANSKELLQIKRDELAEIQSQRESGELTIDEAADKEKEAIAEIAQLRQQAAEAEIANRNAQLSLLDQQLAKEQSAAEYRTGLNELTNQSLADQSSLLDAQLSLLEAQASLSEQRLQSAIEEAEEAGKTEKAERLRNQLLDEQLKTEQEKTKIANEQFKLKVEQQKLDLDNQKLQAENAKLEAEIALQRAVANGASLKEIESLTKILDLRNQQLASLDKQANSQAKLNQLELQALKTQQLQTAEALKQQKAKSAVTSSRGSASRLVPGEVGKGGGIVSGRGNRAPTTKTITNRLDRLGRAGDLNTLLSASTLSLGLKTGLTDTRSLGGGSNADIVGRLDQLIAATKANGNRPNVSVSNVDNVGLAGQIYSNISRNSFRSSGL